MGSAPFIADLRSVQHYYAFGMQHPDRHWSSTNARYGYNGKEKDNSVGGEGTQYDYGFRIYDPRLARFLSVDPLAPEYPWYTPYQSAGNKPIKPIKMIDRDGLEEIDPLWVGSKVEHDLNREWEGINRTLFDHTLAMDASVSGSFLRLVNVGVGVAGLLNPWPDQSEKCGLFVHGTAGFGLSQGFMDEVKLLDKTGSFLASPLQGGATITFGAIGGEGFESATDARAAFVGATGTLGHLTATYEHGFGANGKDVHLGLVGLSTPGLVLISLKITMCNCGLVIKVGKVGKVLDHKQLRRLLSLERQ